jgi:rhodanese-related sulfurtransferase
MQNDKRQFKNAVYEQFARVGKAVSNPKRLELLDLLCQTERTVDAMAQETGMTAANVSQHLQILRSARLVDARKEGLFVKYRVADPVVCEFLRTMRVLAEDRLAEIEQVTRRFFAGCDGMQPVDRRALRDRVLADAVTVLDVRPVEEYKAGHIAGAISIPLLELETRLSELPRGQEIVAYCRGPYCVFAAEAVELLQAKGYTAVRLEDGVHDWRARGYRVETREE